ncbi:phage antirepressor KilAC domain-containing protein [Niastella populi]|uniref:Antirepressor protein C-terminal domain-containing protein n=1 Tax=Niastella populi TaxID=550983 RepID=A0A1V9GAD9_9BACT|nr:phage antirepressor KilAC domain-containing protein [Niastella populi]OQP67635.1 hypothetical protein A4R26_33160 [Niastella populi]
MRLHTFYQVARLLGDLGLGRNKIFQILMKKEIINNRHIPQQKFIDAGYLQYKLKEKYLASKKIYYVVLYATDTGIGWLRNLLIEETTVV